MTGGGPSCGCFLQIGTGGSDETAYMDVQPTYLPYLYKPNCKITKGPQLMESKHVAHLIEEIKQLNKGVFGNSEIGF